MERVRVRGCQCQLGVGEQSSRAGEGRTEGTRDYKHGHFTVSIQYLDYPSSS
jgi:hypothetical protein